MFAGLAGGKLVVGGMPAVTSACCGHVTHHGGMPRRIVGETVMKLHNFEHSIARVVQTTEARYSAGLMAAFVKQHELPHKMACQHHLGFQLNH